MTRHASAAPGTSPRDEPADPWDHPSVPRYHARAEFRRKDQGARWVLAGVVIDHVFYPALPGVERIRRRLREPGLQGWSDLPTEVIAADKEQAADVALEVARSHWPDRVGTKIPFADGTTGRVGRY
jgi:hypothetical protein